MNALEALRIVYDLAYQNRLEDTEGEQELEEEQTRQDEALEKVLQFIKGFS